MRRERVLKVRLSESELARLERLAQAWGIATRAGMLRALLRDAGTPNDPLGLDLLLREVDDFYGDDVAKN
jgi:hypothetical protein